MLDHLLPSISGEGLRPSERLRADAVERLLVSLEQLVRRHRADAADTRHVAVHAELVTAEVAHALALTRNDLQRHPLPTAGW